LGLFQDDEIKWRDIREYHNHKGILKNLSPDEFDIIIDRIYGFPAKSRIKGKLKIIACVVDKNLYFRNYPSNKGDNIYQGSLLGDC
jgi:hypothetical protein